MKVTDFIGERVEYDKEGQLFWSCAYETKFRLLDLRGWSHVSAIVDSDNNRAFHDEIGEWIASAINEKLERERAKEAPNQTPDAVYLGLGCQPAMTRSGKVFHIQSDRGDKFCTIEEYIQFGVTSGLLTDEQFALLKLEATGGKV